MAPEIFQRLVRSPVDAALYLGVGKEELSRAPRQPLAHALFRTARCLDRALPGLDELVASSMSSLGPLINLNPNTYARNRILVEEVARLKGGSGPCSIIDIGGAKGHLARFLDAGDDYFLAEPSVNGISGESIPLPDQSMDFAVSCHVLEHVMPERRTAFLDSMARIARQAFVLLVPVEIAGAVRVAERLQFFIEVTGAKWAKEHLACMHPHPDFFRHYSAERGYALTARPVGNSCAASALELMLHYATPNTKKAELARIKRFFNEHYYADMKNPAESDQYMFTFALRNP